MTQSIRWMEYGANFQPPHGPEAVHRFSSFLHQSYLQLRIEGATICRARERYEIFTSSCKPFRIETQPEQSAVSRYCWSFLPDVTSCGTVGYHSVLLGSMCNKFQSVSGVSNACGLAKVLRIERRNSYSFCSGDALDVWNGLDPATC